MIYRAVLFDMDGTLLDTLEDMTASINAALSAEGLPRRTVDEVRRFVGNGNRKLAERAAGAGGGKDLTERVLRRFHEHYAVHCADHTRPYAGAAELLDRLRGRGIRTAVISNKADYAVRSLAARYFPGGFDCVTGEREGIRRKPAPDGLLAALAEMGAGKDEAVYVGDSDVDIAAARNAGLPCISVTWGFRTKDFLLSRGASQTADTMDELEALLLRKE